MLTPDFGRVHTNSHTLWPVSSGALSFHLTGEAIKDQGSSAMACFSTPDFSLVLDFRSLN